MSTQRPDSPAHIFRTATRNPSLWTGFFSNRVAALAVWVIAPFRLITPNQLTLFGFLVGVATAGAISGGLLPGTPRWVCALLIELYVIIDCIDGQLARYTRRTSEFGKMLDSLLDRLIHPSLLAAIAYYAAAHQGMAMAPYMAFAAYVGHAILYPFGDSSFAGAGANVEAIVKPSMSRRIVRAIRRRILRWFGGMQIFVGATLSVALGMESLFLWVSGPLMVSIAVMERGLIPLDQLRRRTATETTHA